MSRNGVVTSIGGSLAPPAESQSINRAYNSVFRPNRLSLGVVVPLENYSASPVPTMTRHLERVQWAEELGFSAIWLRDVPFNVPSFGDAGQTYDPFVYLGLLAGRTKRLATGESGSRSQATPINPSCSPSTSI